MTGNLRERWLHMEVLDCSIFFFSNLAVQDSGLALFGEKIHFCFICNN